MWGDQPLRAVIIGNGVAGIWTASMLAGSPDVKVMVLTEEDYLYYNKPHLLEYIAGRIEFEKVFVYPEEWYVKRGIDMRLGERALAIDPVRKEVTLKGGKAAYDKLLLSTGGEPILPPIKGVDKKGVFTLRTARDAKSIRVYARGARRAVVVGGGLLGLEVAGALCSLGLGVTVVEFQRRLLPKQIDEQASQLLMSMIEKMGIRVVVGGEVDAMHGEGRLERIALKDGTGLEADLSVISVGIRARVELAASSSLRVGRGIVVDGRMQTSAPDIYACGDVTEIEGKIGGIIPVALDQSKVAALNILGGSATYGGTPHPLTLRVRGVKLASIGDVNATGGDYEERKVVDADRGIYKKVVLKNGLLVGAILLGDTSKLRTIQELISRRRDLSEIKDAPLERDFGELI
ncbi:NAD(P)/FAD-dependent oxidoreductase [bacterium]|nr:MAG: NAD(P)/FAD-dependent oxidoreductase [bacterium]